MSKASTGTYTASLLSTLAGRYRIVWSGSGANSGGLPYADVADVVPADPRLIIPLTDARAALDVPAGVRTDDDEIRALILTATAMIEDVVGAVMSRSVTWTVSGAGRAAILMPEYPTAVSVTEDSVALVEGTGFVWDEFGALWRGSCPGGGSAGACARPNTWGTTSAAAGFASPPDFLEATPF